MKILITGVHGFIGSNLVKQLSPHHQIYGLDIVNPKKDGVLLTFDWIDLERGEIPDVDVIIHLAGKAHDTKNYTQAPVYFEVNTGLTKKIFDYFLASHAEKFIFFSSVKAVADTVNEYALTEYEKPHPIGPYAESKLAAEDHIRDKFDFHHPSEKRVYILRPCMTHGPGNKGNLNLLYKVVSKGIPWPLGSFENRRSFTSIGNLNFVVQQLVDRDIPAGIYNMADDEALSTNELITIIRDTLNSNKQSAVSSQQSVKDLPNQEQRTKAHYSLLTTRIFNLPKPLIQTLASIGTFLHLPLNKSRLHKLTENYVVSNEKIKRALGITAMPVSAVDGLRRTIESFE